MKTFQEFLYECYLSEEKKTRPLSPRVEKKVSDKIERFDQQRRALFQKILDRGRDRNELRRLSGVDEKLKKRTKALRSVLPGIITLDNH